MKIAWSIPVRGERLGSSRGDLVRAKRLIEALRAEGHEIRVVEYASRLTANLVVSAYRNGVRRLLAGRVGLVARDLGRWQQAEKHGRRVAREALAQGAAAIIETQVGFAASGAVAARLTGLPLVLDDCSPSAEEEVLGAGLPGLARWLFRRQMAAASVLVVSSRALARRLVEEGAPAGKIRVIPNGADPAFFAEADGMATRLRLGIEARCVAGFLGSFQRWHATDLLIHAMAALPVRIPLHLLLVGEGPGLEATLEVARRCGLERRVTATGAVPPENAPELVSTFDIGVLPGHTDYSHPMKLVEYAAAGIPAVAPDLPSVREVLEPGVTGLLFRPGDPAALAAALGRLAEDEDLRRRLGDNARRQAARHGSWTERGRELFQAIPTHAQSSAAACCGEFESAVQSAEAGVTEGDPRC